MRHALLILALTACETTGTPATSEKDAASESGNIGLDGAPDADDASSCEGVSEQAEYVPPLIQLVLDISGSMADDAPGGGGSKWTVTRKALNAAVNGSTGLPDVAAVGINFFPGPMGQGTPSCITNEVALPLAALGASHRQALTTALGTAVPFGPTPTHEAYRFGGGTLNESPLAGTPFIALVTDGEATHGENCTDMPDEAALVALVEVARTGGNRTFIIGAPGSELFRETLSQMATAGGTARAGCSDTGPEYCHFDMTSSADLAADLGAALSEIVGTTLGCEFEIPPAPAGQTFDENRVNVRVTASDGAARDLLKDPSGLCASGWRYSVDKTRVELCGTECDDVKQDPAARVDILFGCLTDVL